ncbi:hypothetical protein [Cloacibacterium sp.]|uniref:hypothetical protein n=1 Tax=Cloacibacterium sp. TaxID=1913682 RepID=UPI0039E5F117
MKNNKIDIVFFDIEMNDVNCIELLQIIPKNTFVIYIPEFSPFVNRTSRINSEKHLESQIPKRFCSGIHEAQIFLNLVEKNNHVIFDDYFVI